MTSTSTYGYRGDGNRPISVLFVDDEQQVRNGLQRMLHGMRDVWAMRFAESGQEALEIMRASHVDVVVSDMRMPGMDGEQLLAEVKRLFPQTVRVVLSGQVNEGAAARTIDSIHIFLSKPCTKDNLIDTINRATKLRAMFAEARFQGAIDELQRLPRLPSAYYAFLDALREPEPRSEKLARAIAEDARLVARVLQLGNTVLSANSALTDPAQMIRLIGTDIIHSLVLLIGAAIDVEEPQTALERLEHAAATASISRSLAHELGFGRFDAASSFSAGLLHDIGLLMFSSLMKEPARTAFDGFHKESRSLCEREQSEIGASHAELGAYLLALWGLPDATVEAVAYHHDPVASGVRRVGVVATVHVASALTDGDSAEPELAEQHLERLGILPIINRWRVAKPRFHSKIS